MRGGVFLIIGSLIINFCLAAVFYQQWGDSSEMMLIASVIGLGSKTFVMICSCVGAVAALPFTIFFIDKLLNMQKKSSKWNQWIMSSKAFWFCCVISAIGLLTMIMFAFSKCIGLDEAFSLALVRHNYRDLIRLTGMDVHPPLYYLILKTVLDGGRLCFPEIPSVYLAKLVSVVPYVVLLGAGMTKVRKNWGNYVAGMWMLCVVGMSYLINYGIEIRMYSWSVLFVTFVFLSVNDIVCKKSKVSWLKLVIFSLAAAYTHYYACIAAGVCYLMLLVWFAMNDRKQLKKWCVAAMVTIGAYLPWLFVLINQLHTVSNDYWISDLTVPTVLYYFAYAFDNPLFLFLCLFMVIQWMREWKREIFGNWTQFFSVSGLLIPVGVILVGTIASVIIRPVFIYRYEIPALACLWLAFLIGLVLKKKEWAVEGAFCLAVLASVTRICAFSYTEQKDYIQSEDTCAFLDANGENTIYICGSTDLYGLMVLEEMSGCQCYILENKIDDMSFQVYEKIDTLYQFEEIVAFLSQGKNVYFMGDSEKADKFVSDSGLKLAEAGSYQVRGFFEFYQVLPGINSNDSP